MELSGETGVKLAAHAIRSTMDAQSHATQGLSPTKGALGSGENAGKQPAAKVSISDAGRLNMQENGVQAAADEGLRIDNDIMADEKRAADERSGDLETIESASGAPSGEFSGIATDQPEGLTGPAGSQESITEPAIAKSVNLLV